MDKRGRLLVVEDDEDLRELYRSTLRDQFTVDAVGTLAAAREAIDRRAHHAALVDIMLAGNDTSNTDGTLVLQYLHQQSKGTRMLVLSGQRSMVLVRDVLSDFPHLEYVFKDEISKKGAAFLLSRVSAAAAAAMNETSIKWEDAIATMALGLSEAAFVSACLKLDFNGGFENLSRSICSVYEQLSPLLIQRQTTVAMRHDRSPLVLCGTFWSKGQGTAVDLLLFGRSCPHETLEELWPMAGRNVVYERSKAGLSIMALERADLGRDQFRAGDSVTNA